MRVPKLYLITITAVIVAAIVVTYPKIVVFGLWALIVPGLIMGVMPTAACYLVAASALRIFMPSRLGNWRTPAAFAGAVIVGFIVVQPSRHADLVKFHAAILPDIITSALVPIRGNIMVQGFVQDGSGNDGRGQCDAFCAALLITPGVTSVTLSARPGQAAATTWRLVPRGSVPDLGLAPVHPEQLDGTARQAAFVPGAFPSLRAEQEAVAASWALRLATTQTLVVDHSAPSPDDILIITDQHDGFRQHVARAELRDRAGTLLLRRSNVTAHVFAQPLWFELWDAMNNDTRFVPGRELISTGPAYVTFDAVHELLTHVAVAGPPAAPDAPGLMRQQLAAALDTPGNPGGLALAGQWIDSLGYGQVSPGDTELFRRIIGDLRIHDIAHTVTKYRSLLESCGCRNVLVDRIVAPETSSDDRRLLTDALVRMPPGSFASMTENERRIIDDPDLRRDASAFIERLADAGRPGLDKLMTILRQAVRDPDLDRQAPIVRAVRKGLARMGSQAADALPEVRDIFKRDPPPAMRPPEEEMWWRVTMVRMGLPISELSYPSDWPEVSKDNEQRQVIAAVAHFEPGQ